MDIKTIRKELGLSQSKFAEKIGTTQQTVSLWEEGRTKPRPATIERINKLLEGHCADRIPKRQGTIKPYIPPKRPKIRIDVWPFYRKEKGKK